jgi:GH15 family glucan-1,4-alpha-glucosidase
MSDDSREMISNILNWDEELQTFLQSKGTKGQDASVPLMPLIRFISPVDPMWRSTVKVIEARLVEDTLSVAMRRNARMWTGFQAGR